LGPIEDSNHDRLDVVIGDDCRNGRLTPVSAAVFTQHDSFYHQLVQALPCAVVVVGSDGMFLEANPAAESILGLTHAELAALSIGQLSTRMINEDGDQLGDANNPILECLAKAQPQRERTIGIVRHDGQILWTIFFVVPLFDPDSNRFSGAGVSFIDISERKASEEKLRRSEQFHRLISEVSSDYGYSCKVAADGAAVMDEVTAGFTRVTGYTLEELNAQGGWASFIHPDDLLVKPVEVGARTQRGEPGMTELRIITKQGQTLWIRFSTRPIWDEKAQRVTRLVGAVLDISERVEAQQKIQEHAERLQVMSRRLLKVQEAERRRLACELHDEIGQLLTGLELTLAASQRFEPDELRKNHAKIQRLIRDLTKYIRDMSLRLRPTMLDDLGLLPALLWHFRRCEEQLEVRVQFEHSGLDERMDAETETAAFRILQEALTNVARHADVDSALVQVRREQGRVFLRVQDHGVGFDAEAALTSGVSTGLSGMRERALLLGGQFSIDSIFEQGTTIYAELPVQDKGELYAIDRGLGR